MLPLPTLPNVFRSAWVNARFSQFLQGLVVIPAAAQDPGPRAAPTNLALSCPMPVPERFVPETIVSGRPVRALTMPPSCQLPKMLRARMFDLDKRGSCQMKDATKLCLRSKSERPRSNLCRKGSSHGRADTLSAPMSVTPPPGGRSSMLFDQV